jgi:hypothetical protein
MKDNVYHKTQIGLTSNSKGTIDAIDTIVAIDAIDAIVR